MGLSKKDREILKHCPKWNNEKENFDIINLWADNFSDLESMKARIPIYTRISQQLFAIDSNYPQKTHTDIKARLGK